MANSNTIFSEILARIQEVLNQFNCKSETRTGEHEALLYGKFSDYTEKYTIVVHLREENYKPVTGNAGKVELQESDRKVHVMPSLELQSYKGHSAKCSEKEQMDIRERFLKDAEAIGREFMQKINKGKSQE